MIDTYAISEKAVGSSTAGLRLKTKAVRVNKREWLNAALDGRERAQFTGRIVVVMDYKAGSCRQMRIEEVTATNYSDN